MQITQHSEWAPLSAERSGMRLPSLRKFEDFHLFRTKHKHLAVYMNA